MWSIKSTYLNSTEQQKQKRNRFRRSHKPLGLIHGTCDMNETIPAMKQLDKSIRFDIVN